MCRWAQLDAGLGQPEADSDVHKMAMNIGRRPSIEDGTDITVEVHILHSFAAADFRGQQLRVVVGGFIRHAAPGVIIAIITGCSCQKRQGASANKVHVEASTKIPLLGLTRSKQDNHTVGTVLSIYTGPRQPGPRG